MRQAIINFNILIKQSFDSFIAGENTEALKYIKDLLYYNGDSMYLFGDKACGKTHLLKAASLYNNTIFVHATNIYKIRKLEDLKNTTICIDNVDQLSIDSQNYLFNLINNIKLNNRFLLSGNTGTLALRLRNDLRTRISKLLSYKIIEPTDENKILILKNLLESNGLEISTKTTEYILSRNKRDLHSLIDIIKNLNSKSLEHKRPITILLAKDLINTCPDI